MLRILHSARFTLVPIERRVILVAAQPQCGFRALARGCRP